MTFGFSQNVNAIPTIAPVCHINTVDGPIAPKGSAVFMGDVVYCIPTHQGFSRSHLAANFEVIRPNGIVAIISMGENLDENDPGILMDQPGTWVWKWRTIDPDVVATIYLNASFFVVPESAIGTIGLSLASLAALGSYVFIKRRRNAQSKGDI